MQINSTTLHTLQTIEINLLKIFINICEKRHLRYYLIGGTLLGAVRHKGFIPWDDDIDVGMPRKDYEKFLQLAPEFLPQQYFLQTYRTEIDAPWPFAKLRDNNTLYKESATAKLPVHQGLWIDIFPLDYCNLKTFWIVSLVKRMLGNRVGLRLVGPRRLSRKLLGCLSPLFCPSWYKAVEWQDKLGNLYSWDTGYMGNFFGRYGRKEIVPSSWFKEPVYLEFEEIQVAAPTEYHKYLTHIYGDYMQLPPEEKRVSLHPVSEIKFNLDKGGNK